MSSSTQSGRPVRSRPSTILLAAGVLLAACGGETTTSATGGSEPEPAGTVDHGQPDDATTSSGSEGGFDVAAAPGEFDPASGQAVVGRVEQDGNGCWYLSNNGETALLIAPVGTSLGEDGTSLVTADGSSITDGSPVDTVGTFRELTSLPGGADGRWANQVAGCSPPGPLALVADSLAPAFDPAIVDPDTLAEELRASLFTSDFGCGHGFATGDSEQRWALRIELLVPEPIGPDLVTLPDDRFEVTVSAGAHLLANHCDDVAEWFEPFPIEVVRWDVVGGEFDYPGPVDVGCTGGEAVTTRLVGADVDTPAGMIRLDPIEITNDSFGCFAG